MRTLDTPTSATASALRRDLALLLRIARMVYAFATAGARLRRAYRRCQARGEVLWVDALGPTHHREEALQRR